MNPSGPIIVLAVMLATGLASLSVCSAQPVSSPGPFKPRIINTTDLGADPDDEQSMVRQLVCANEYDIEGLIVSTGCWKKSQSSTAMLDAILKAYAEVLPNLRVHAKGYPSYEYLASISVMGNTGYGMEDVGTGKDSPGSNLIIAAVDRDDPRPLWVTGWGGVNTIAQALWSVRETRTPNEVAVFVSRLRVFDILGQDDAGAWIAREFPDLLYIRARKVYGWQPSDAYLDTHIQSHGPLGAVYPDRSWATEGDTPSFLHLYPNGLNDPEQIHYGGWGGRFQQTRTEGIRGMSCIEEGTESRFDPYLMHGDTDEGVAAIRRWQEGFNNDFAARMDWTLTDNYDEANHHPVAVLNGDTTRQVLYMQASPGDRVTLSAEGSSDPDGDFMRYSWLHYREPGTYPGAVSVSHDFRETATVDIPGDAQGKTIHIVLRLIDDGSPELRVYRRVVIQVQ